MARGGKSTPIFQIFGYFDDTSKKVSKQARNDEMLSKQKERIA
jgi:hypothetical protein